MRRALAELDRGIVTRATTGDLAAIEQVLNAAYGYVRNVLFRMVGPSPDVDDLQQTVLMRISESIVGYRGDAQLHVWVTQICLNVVRDEFRQRASQRRRLDAQTHLVAASSDAVPDSASSFEVKEKLARSFAALEHIPHEQRAVFVLKAMLGHSIEEIAEIMGTPISTTRQRLYYARKAFYKAIEARLPTARPGGERDE